MLRNIIFGGVIPLVFLLIGGGTFWLLQRPEPPKVAQLGDNIPALLNVLPIAEVKKVRALSELSQSLNIPVTGTVVPYRELQLAAEVQGRIMEKAPTVRSGNYVTKGQELYRIDPRDYQLNIERLTRRKEQELASLQELDQEIQNSQSLLDVVKEQLSLADGEVKRLESLGSGFASASELDAARRTRLTAMNQKVTVQNQLSTAKTRRSRLELAIQTAETELEQAQLDLERTVVTAPVNGRIVSEQVEIDSYVQRGSQMIVIEDTEKVEVLTNIRMEQLYWILDQHALSAEELVNPVQASRYELPKTPVNVRFNAGNREDAVYQWRGRLDRYDGAGLDAQSRTIPIRIVVDQPSEFKLLSNGEEEQQSEGGPPMLVRGMFVDAVIETKPATPLVLVPKLSIKPATMSYQIWKYTKDDQAIYYSRQALREKLQREEEAKAESDGSDTSNATPENSSDSSEQDVSPATDEENELPDPDQWQSGFLEIVENVRVVASFVTPEGDTMVDGTAYSICEVTTGINPGDLVIVTPLPGIEMGTQTPVRVRADDLSVIEQ
ncbi:MAG: HlyD family efflux transporter periplasmic adaptor subunit [Aureliella sp.]